MDAAMTTQLSKLRTLDLKGLQEAYQDAFGRKSKSRNREWLFKAIARKIQDGVEPETPAKPTLTAKFVKTGRSKNKTKATKAGDKKPAPKDPLFTERKRDPRLPQPGTTIQRVYKGKTLHVRVMADGLGFEYEGKSYRSLSALAKHITKSIVNGFVWFGLGVPAKKEKTGK